MKSLFSNILKFSVISAIAVCGLCACSDDSSNNSGSNQDPNNIVPPPDTIPTPTAISPITINSMKTQASGDRSIFMISGGAGLNLNDTTAIPKGAEVYFMEIKLSINKIVNGQVAGTPLQVTCNGEPCRLKTPLQIINLAELNAVVEDHNRSDCGTFRITASYFASYDANQPHMFVDNDSYEFVREESACEVPEENPTPVETPQSKVVLTSYEVTVNTKKGDGLSLATGSVVPADQADLRFTSDDLTDEIKVATGNGATIAAYTNDADGNYDDDWNITDLPPEPVHMSDFRFSERSMGTSIPFFDSFVFYVVKTTNYNAETGDGFYAFTTKSTTIPDDNKNIQITLLVYKK